MDGTGMGMETFSLGDLNGRGSQVADAFGVYVEGGYDFDKVEHGKTSAISSYSIGGKSVVGTSDIIPQSFSAMVPEK